MRFGEVRQSFGEDPAAGMETEEWGRQLVDAARLPIGLTLDVRTALSFYLPLTRRVHSIRVDWSRSRSEWHEVKRGRRLFRSYQSTLNLYIMSGRAGTTYSTTFVLLYPVAPALPLR